VTVGSWVAHEPERHGRSMNKRVLEAAAQRFADASAKPPFLYELRPEGARMILDDVQAGPFANWTWTRMDNSARGRKRRTSSHRQALTYGNGVLVVALLVAETVRSARLTSRTLRRGPRPAPEQHRSHGVAARHRTRLYRLCRTGFEELKEVWGIGCYRRGGGWCDTERC
jgi:hypothetical protein